MRSTKAAGCTVLAVLLGTIGHATTCWANFYSFTYVDSIGDAANGDLFAASPPISGSIPVTGGFIDVTASSSGFLATGTYPWVATSPHFAVDNVIFPANDGPGGYMTSGGILFSDGSTEINTWGNGGANNYSFYAWTPAANDYSPAFDPNVPTTTGTFTLQYVPEPSSLVLAGVAGALAVGYGVRRRRKA
jgi:hypothetical protein